MHCLLLRNVHRIVKKELFRTFGFSANYAWLSFFTQSLTRWHYSYVYQEKHVLCLQNARTVWTAMQQLNLNGLTGWNSFVANLDAMRLVGHIGTLQTLKLFVDIWDACILANISPLGIRRILTHKNTQDLYNVVHSSSDNFDSRNQSSIIPNTIICATNSFLNLFKLGQHANISLLLDIIWLHQLDISFERAAMFPIIDTPAKPDPVPREKHKQFLIFLLPEEHKNYALIRSGPFPLLLKQHELHVKTCMQVYWIIELYYKIRILCSLWYACKYHESKQRRLTVVFRIRTALQKWLLQTRKKQAKKARRKQKKLAIQEAKFDIIRPIIDVWCFWVRKKQFVHKFLDESKGLHDAIVAHIHRKRSQRKHHDFHVSIVNSWCKWTRRSRVIRMMKQNTSLCNAIQRRVYKIRQARKVFYMSTPQGAYCLAHLRMVRSLLKQLLRIATKCLGFLIDKLNGKTIECREYLEIATFALEPFHFHLLRCPRFNENPDIDELIKIFEPLCSKKFTNKVLKWIMCDKKLVPYVGCVPVFRHISTLFLEYQAYLVCIPNAMLASCFIPFTLVGIEKQWYKRFCLDHEDLSRVWCINQELLQEMVCGWILQGGRNFDLLDMLTQISQACITAEKLQPSTAPKTLKKQKLIFTSKKN